MQEWILVLLDKRQTPVLDSRNQVCADIFSYMYHISAESQGGSCTVFGIYHLSKERLNNNKNAPDLLISCETGSPFHTDLGFLHAINHLQEEHQGKSV